MYMHKSNESKFLNFGTPLTFAAMQQDHITHNSARAGGINRINRISRDMQKLLPSTRSKMIRITHVTDVESC